jgi:hypothetical protein
MAKRNYDNEFPSVTQVLDCLRKPGLEWWFKQNDPAFIKAESERSKQIGTDTHSAIQSFIETGKASVDTQYAEEVTTALKSFMLFKQEHPNIELKKAEVQLTSKKYKFNGTLDCAGVYINEDGNRETIVVDWKTSKVKNEDSPKIYDEYKVQVSSYCKLWEEKFRQPIHRAVIVAVAKDKVSYNWYVLDEKEINECFKQVFLPALKICNFQRKKK